MKYKLINTKDDKGNHKQVKVYLMPERCKCEKRKYKIVKRKRINVL